MSAANRYHLPEVSAMHSLASSGLQWDLRWILPWDRGKHKWKTTRCCPLHHASLQIRRKTLQCVGEGMARAQYKVGKYQSEINGSKGQLFVGTKLVVPFHGKE